MTGSLVSYLQTMWGKLGLSHIVADFRQDKCGTKFHPKPLSIQHKWRKSVLPHNLAWPFLPFLPVSLLPSLCAYYVARKRVLKAESGFNTEENASVQIMWPLMGFFLQFFSRRLTCKAVRKHVFVKSRHDRCGRTLQVHAGETATFWAYLNLVIFFCILHG